MERKRRTFRFTFWIPCFPNHAMCQSEIDLHSPHQTDVNSGHGAILDTKSSDALSDSSSSISISSIIHLASPGTQLALLNFSKFSNSQHSVSSRASGFNRHTEKDVTRRLIRALMHLPKPLTDLYKIFGLLGWGGNGVVMEALDRHSQLPVAIKFVKKSRFFLGGDAMIWDAEFKRKILMEAFVLKSIQHQNIVNFLMLLEGNSYHYIVMELVATPHPPHPPSRLSTMLPSPSLNSSPPTQPHPHQQFDSNKNVSAGVDDVAIFAKLSPLPPSDIHQTVQKTSTIIQSIQLSRTISENGSGWVEQGNGVRRGEVFGVKKAAMQKLQSSSFENINALKSNRLSTLSLTAANARAISIQVTQCDADSLLHFMRSSEHHHSPVIFKPLFRQLVAAYVHIRSKRFVYLDFKMENVLVTGRGTDTDEYRVKLVDFGLARYEGGKFTQYGTKSMSAPEIANQKHYDGEKADLWALGMILYRLVLFSYPSSSAEKEIDGADDNFAPILISPSSQDFVDLECRRVLGGLLCACEQRLSLATLWDLVRLWVWVVDWASNTRHRVFLMFDSHHPPTPPSITVNLGTVQKRTVLNVLAYLI